MNSNKPMIIGLIIFLAILGFAFISVFAISKNTEDSEPVQDTNLIPIEETTDEEESSSEELTSDSEETVQADPTPGQYVVFSGDDSVNAVASFANSTDSDGTNLLFFHAGWCPTCRSLENDLNKNLSEIPSDVNIIQVDYDSYSSLKSAYDVRVQHTIIEIDDSGNVLRRLSAPMNTLEQLERSLEIS